MFDWIFERLANWGKTPVTIVLSDKRKINRVTVEGLDIRNFFVNPQVEDLQKIVRNFKLDTPESVVDWVDGCVDYVADKDGDFWQLPFETLTLLTADCDDIAILVANLLLATGKNYYDVMLNVGNTPYGYHAFATYRGQVVDPLFPHVHQVPDDWDVLFSWNSHQAYSEVLK